MRLAYWAFWLLSVVPLFAQTGLTCPLYGSVPQCAGYVYHAPPIQINQAPAPAQATTPETQEQQNYETGNAIGSSMGQQFFYRHFSGWRRGYCSAHPEQPFFYGNARGDKITGTCPSQDQLAYEAATEWLAKHLKYTPSAENGAAMDSFIAENHLARWQPKSYDVAFKSLGKARKLSTK
jgi:hypothetical protein